MFQTWTVNSHILRGECYIYDGASARLGGDLEVDTVRGPVDRKHNIKTGQHNNITKTLVIHRVPVKGM